MKLIKVEGHPNLYRDSNTGAIIHKDLNGYDQYLQSSYSRMNAKKEIQQLKNDVSEIKSLLKELINGSK